MRPRPRGSSGTLARTRSSSSRASCTTPRNPRTRFSGTASRGCSSSWSLPACGHASPRETRRSRATSTTRAAVRSSREQTAHRSASCVSSRAIISGPSRRTRDSSRARTARRCRDGVAGAARHGRGFRRTPRSAPGARRGEKARHPHGAPRRSRRRISGARARDGRPAGRRSVGVPGARVAARPPQSAEPPAESRTAAGRGRRVRGGAPLETPGIRDRPRARRPTRSAPSGRRARLPSRGRNDRAAAEGRRGRRARFGMVARSRARQPAPRGRHRHAQRALLGRATDGRDRSGRCGAGACDLHYHPRRSPNDRFRCGHVHRASRSVPARRDRSGAGRALRGHRDHEEGDHIRSELANAIEAILFVAEKPVTRGELGRIAGGTPRAVENALAELAAAYEGTGLRLQRSGDEWQIVTAPQHAPQVAAYLGADRLRLSAASLETLSVVAYRQPVTRAEVEAIRGVNCDQTIYTLASRRLIEERGRKEAPGRPILYGTTWEFLECFGLQSLDDLPRALSPEGAVLETAGGRGAEPPDR